MTAPGEGREFSMGEFLRDVLREGADIKELYHAGGLPTYERYSARLDEAARKREAEYNNRRAPITDAELMRAARVLFAQSYRTRHAGAGGFDALPISSAHDFVLTQKDMLTMARAILNAARGEGK